MARFDEFKEANERYAASFDQGGLPMPPARQVAVVTCMDARLHPEKFLGLEVGDAHVIRNAGGRVSEDAIRSLVISERLLGTDEIVVIHHTDCGMLTFTDDGFKAEIRADTGAVPDWDSEAFTDLPADVRKSVERVKASAFVPHRDAVRGFVFDVATGRLEEVEHAA